MSLPNIDISPLLEIAWKVLQYSIRWAAVLALLVFVGILIAGAGDIFAENMRSFKEGRKERKVSRTRE